MRRGPSSVSGILLFSADRDVVQLTMLGNFTTNPYPVPLGSATTTISLNMAAGPAFGSYDPSTGLLALPVPLKIDHTVHPVDPGQGCSTLNT